MKKVETKEKIAKKNTNIKKATVKNNQKKVLASNYLSVENDKIEVDTRKKRISILKKIIFIAVVFTVFFFLKGLVFAGFIGNTPIFRFEVIKELEKQSGRVVFDNIVTKKLILAEASKKNITVSDSEIEDEIKTISESLSNQGTDLDSFLEYQGVEMSELKSNIRLQKIAEQLISDKITVSDEEINDYYEENKIQFDASKNLEDLRDQIENLIKQNKFTTEFSTYISDLKNSTRIIEFVKY